ncbi:ComEC/Rec2 family competence protein [Arthrobacter cupressi]|uniref:Competence protein ComEC n=1 Tax=Arthrobacter cupressi TaxID=1045773 RepID=A0A1G8WYV6_9MICC|nr:ComEC/Rec2 family competence protein [Arthrobacter cupressi]NYD79935.1 competence protein ComEC [Arthrobacter cupressi]SDJ83572.1 competence protein ComEC [Arthrobacter cupressi]
MSGGRTASGSAFEEVRADDDPAPRLDLRLVPAALLAWIAALAGSHLPPAGTAAVAVLLAVTAVVLVAGRRWWPGVRPWKGRRRNRKPVRRSMAAGLALACLLGAATAAHTLTAATARSNLPVPGDDGGALVLLLVTREAAEARTGAGGAERWILGAELLELAVDGSLHRPATRILVVGGDGWSEPQPGQRIRAGGKLTQARPGQAEAAVFTAGTRPLPAGGSLRRPDVTDGSAPGGGAGTSGDWAATMRERYRDAATGLGGDPAGLLPGMVIGDTDGMDEGLVAAMRDTGTVHLTAVSGANCSLILGLLIVLARSCRLGRPAAAVVALCGLAAFVWLVGPEPSVLRAAVMGAIGLLGLSSGRPGRGLGFLWLAVAVLLACEPPLAGSPGFLLSVLATLGIILLARPLMERAPAWLPRPVAAALAVPLSAQVFCAPVIVGLQPQFTVFSLLANVAMAPFVAPVTVLGTLAVPALAVHEGAATVLMGAAAVCAGAIAGIARALAGLPQAVLPWPEGAWGMVTMAACSTGNLAVLWLVIHPDRCMRFALNCHGFVVERIEDFEAWLERRRRVFRRRMRPPRTKRLLR